MIYSLVKPFLFLMSPERAHRYTMMILRCLHTFGLMRGSLRRTYRDSEFIDFMGIKFPNKLGLAAGFDKNAEYIDLVESLGFGSIEIGTITPRPQVGNPKPRLFRITRAEALINRMGFNNLGLDATILNLKKFTNRSIIIGGNIGKNKDTPNESAVDDYLKCFIGLYPYVDYFTINVSSPNTPNLRALQDRKSLIDIISALQAYRHEQSIYRPICLKISPDLSPQMIEDIVDVYRATQLDALVVSNTTLQYSLLGDHKSIADDIGSGGLSGAPIYDLTTQVIAQLLSHDSTLNIIGVGGIDSSHRAIQRIREGCKLIQIYSGMIYKGPSLISNILDHLHSNSN